MNISGILGQLLLWIIGNYFYDCIKETKENKLSQAELQSLRTDFIKYFNELLIDLSLKDKKLWEGWQILIWKNVYQELWQNWLNVNNVEFISNNLTDSNPIVAWLKNYLEYWNYKNFFNDFKDKMNAYWNSIGLCAMNCVENNKNKLKLNRAALDEFVSENIENFKILYADFMLSISNPWASQEEKEILFKNKDLFLFEEYIPSIKKYFDKMENRVCVE